MRKGHKQDTEGSFIFWVRLTVKTPGLQQENVLRGIDIIEPRIHRTKEVLS